jgi:plasmid stabilization system protein ParE
METEPKIVVSSVELEEDLKEIYLYSLETFGRKKADEYLYAMKSIIRQLAVSYLMYSECPQIPTKGKIYRCVKFESHIIIYRINERVEVLRIFHSASSNFKIRTVRKIITEEI